MSSRLRCLALACGAPACLPQPARAADWPMLAGNPARNAISPERDPPTDWDVGDPDKPGDGRNVKWEARLGSQSYGNVVVANGVVWVGTNNEARYDPRFTKDGGCLLAFRESDGRFLWQNYSPKLPSGRVNDWPYQGVCSSPLVQGDRVWYCTNRGEVLCYDVAGLADGRPPREVWRLDMMKELGVFPHNMTNCSPVAHGGLLYVVTANGVDDTHKHVPAPQAPALIAVDQHTGRVVWQRNPVGDRILHGQWANPALAEANGRTLVVAPLGDGWVYAFDARTGEPVWWFDTNRKAARYPTTRNELIAPPVIVGGRMYIANGQDPEHGEGAGHLWCVDVTKRGDVSLELAGEALPPDPTRQEWYASSNAARPRAARPNPNSAVVWHFEQLDANRDGKVRRAERMNRTISAAVVAGGLVFVPDFSGFLHCFDAETGAVLWTHDMDAAVWGWPLVVDGTLYLGDEDGDVAVFAVGREERLLAEHNMGSPVYTQPVYANGVLYVMTRDRLFAVRDAVVGEGEGEAADAVE